MVSWAKKSVPARARRVRYACLLCRKRHFKGSRLCAGLQRPVLTVSEAWLFRRIGGRLSILERSVQGHIAHVVGTHDVAQACGYGRLMLWRGTQLETLGSSSNSRWTAAGNCRSTWLEPRVIWHIWHGKTQIVQCLASSGGALLECLCHVKGKGGLPLHTSICGLTTTLDISGWRLELGSTGDWLGILRS